MLALGLVLIGLSVFFYSSVSSVIGLGLTFWGAILLYITPSKHVSLQLLNAVATSPTVNIERLLEESALHERGIYLSPKHLEDFESSLVFVPATENQNLPAPEQTGQNKLYLQTPLGALLTPPGLDLSKLIEQELGMSFTKINLKTLEEKLPKLLVEDLELAEQVEIKSQSNKFIITINNTVLNQICTETRNLHRVHAQIGNVLSSALACAFAKTIGKSVVIQTQELSEDGKNAQIEIQPIEE
jgi:hypothetical protein